jgi:hypothetical protein
MQRTKKKIEKQIFFQIFPPVVTPHRHYPLFYTLTFFPGVTFFPALAFFYSPVI